MKIRFASCNILYDDAKSEPLWPQRLGLLKSAIMGWKPDILATQEGRKPQLFQLRDALAADYELLDAHRSWHESKMYPCLFVKKGKFQCLESHDRWLSETPAIEHSKSFGSKWPKLATFANLKAGGEDFAVASFHFDNVEPAARPLQAQVLIDEMTKLYSSGAVVFMGDANDLPHSPTLEFFRSAGYEDPWKWQSVPHTFHGFSPAVKGGRIDYVLHSCAFKSEGTYCDKRCSDYYSDHYLIYADLQLG